MSYLYHFVALAADIGEVNHLGGPAHHASPTPSRRERDDGSAGAHCREASDRHAGRIDPVQADQANAIDITDHQFPRSFML
ncbi:hypothetical protein V6767_12590 [Martelella sp. FLE1502]